MGTKPAFVIPLSKKDNEEMGYHYSRFENNVFIKIKKHLNAPTLTTILKEYESYVHDWYDIYRYVVYSEEGWYCEYFLKQPGTDPTNTYMDEVEVFEVKPVYTTKTITTVGFIRNGN